MKTVNTFARVVDGQVIQYPIYQQHLTGKNIDGILPAVIPNKPADTREQYHSLTFTVNEDNVTGEWVAQDRTVAQLESYDQQQAEKLERERSLQVVSMRQTRLVLLSKGLLDDVEAWVASADRAAQIEWEFASEVKRSSHLVAQIKEQLNISEEQLDDMFAEAVKL